MAATAAVAAMAAVPATPERARFELRPPALTAVVAEEKAAALAQS
jgi:hypothetical protein